MRLANVGVDGFNRWSFLNRGDLDGQWQYVDTWDRDKKRLLQDFPPHPNSYFGLGLLSRFTAKRSAVLGIRVSPAVADGWQRVHAAAFRSPAGQVTVAVVNDGPADYRLKLSLAGGTLPGPLYRYRYGEPEYDRADVRVEPGREFAAGAGAWEDTLPRNSLTVYSTYRRGHDDPGVLAEEPVKVFPIVDNLSVHGAAAADE